MYPNGDVTEASSALVAAVNEAFRILGYFELPEENQPPQNIWGSHERLKEWFASVRQRMKNPTTSTSMEVIEDADDDYFDSDVSDLRKV